MIRVALVDDEAAVRKGIRLRLELEADIQVVGESATACGAFELARSAAPHVIVLDVELPDGNGVHLARRLAADAPATRVIVLTLHDDEHTRADALAAGAHAFVSKSVADAALVDAIRSAASSAQSRTGDPA